MRERLRADMAEQELGEERGRVNAVQHQLESERKLREAAERQVMQLQAAPPQKQQQEEQNMLVAPPAGTMDGYVPVATVQLMTAAMTANAAAMSANLKVMESAFGAHRYP
jgi:hypothetical protein